MSKYKKDEIAAGRGNEQLDYEKNEDEENSMEFNS